MFADYNSDQKRICYLSVVIDYGTDGSWVFRILSMKKCCSRRDDRDFRGTLTIICRAFPHNVKAAAGEIAVELDDYNPYRL
jgi:hypothetical protein